MRLLIAVCPFGAVFVQEQFVKPVPGHTGAAVVVAEGQHIAIGPPGPLPIPAGPVVGRRVDAVSPGKIAASAVLPAGDIIVIEVGGEALFGPVGVVHQTDHGAIVDVDHIVGVRRLLPVGEVDAAGIAVDIPICLVFTVRAFPLLQHPQLLQRVAGAVHELVDIGGVGGLDVLKLVVGIHPGQLLGLGHTV